MMRLQRGLYGANSVSEVDGDNHPVKTHFFANEDEVNVFLASNGQIPPGHGSTSSLLRTRKQARSQRQGQVTEQRFNRYGR